VSAATTRAAATASDSPRQLTWPRPEPLRLKVIEWGSIVFVGGFLLIEGPRNLAAMPHDAINLLVWLAAVAVTDLLYVPLWGTTLAMSFPILLAAAMLFPPVVAGLLALLGTTDQREFRRQIPIGRSLFNRSQIALSVLAGSFLFHGLGAELDNWPWVLPAAVLALIADSAVNFLSLIGGWRAAGMSSVRQGPVRIFGPEPLSFMLTYVGFGLTAVPLAIVYEAVGAWGLLAFVIPVLLGHQAFVQSERFHQMAGAVSVKTEALRTVSARIADERRDERLAVAAGLHDELLPPLYQVHLMGQVLRQDLATGQLLSLEDDLPRLLGATQQASDATQGLIRGLRHSNIGAGGLVGTLRLLARDIESRTSCNVILEAEDVGGSPVVQLLAYQVAREALRNAARHADAVTIRISLSRGGSDMRLIIEDDGSGFDPNLVDADRHFGLQLMKERVELAGGVLHVESIVGQGTTIAVRLPAETSAETN
jgi:signal transduction histidine kinase